MVNMMFIFYEIRYWIKLMLIGRKLFLENKQTNKKNYAKNPQEVFWDESYTTDQRHNIA